MDELLPLTAAAKRLRVPNETLLRWAREGAIPVSWTAGGRRGKGHRRYDPRVLDEFKKLLRQDMAQDERAKLIFAFERELHEQDTKENHAHEDNASNAVV